MNIGDVDYHVEVKGQGEPLVLLHGFTGSGETWRNHVGDFSQNFRVVTIDLLGHGQTDSPADPDRYRIEHAASDLIAIFDRLELGQVHLLGYSMGARLALYTAVHHPVRIQTLTLESGSPGLEKPAERLARVEQDSRLADMLENDGLEKFVLYWESLPMWKSQSEEIRAQLHAQRLQNDPVGLRNSLLGMGTGVQPSLWDDLHTLSMPVLLIAGELDAKFSDIARQMQIPNAQRVIIPGAGHTPHVEQPVQFRHVVIDFLK
jgi:2-succinyl-6-hydroxy-2,4-cyclohexadiene-1-carboxylate synthase